MNHVPCNDGNIVPYICSERSALATRTPQFCPENTGKAIKFTGLRPKKKKRKGPGRHVEVSKLLEVQIHENLKSTVHISNITVVKQKDKTDGRKPVLYGFRYLTKVFFSRMPSISLSLKVVLNIFMTHTHTHKVHLLLGFVYPPGN